MFLINGDYYHQLVILATQYIYCMLFGHRCQGGGEREGRTDG